MVKELKRRPWMTTRGNRRLPVILNGRPGNMYDFYDTYFRRFGELLTDMEAVGIKVDRQHLVEAEERARCASGPP